VPNERSSHSFPTPRGGGISIVFGFLFALICVGFFNLMTWNVVTPIFIGGLLTAIVGFLDDKGHIKARYRLIVHFFSAYLLVLSSNGLPTLIFWGTSINLGGVGWALSILGVVWMLNLYNFMDGINGIASIEAISSCLVMSLLIFFWGDSIYLSMLHAVLMFIVLGFLFWNFPRAKIFMGDAGSGFLGLMIASLILHSALLGSEFFWAWLIMLGVFIVDATYTLLFRLLKGFKPYDAHRSHAYQIASRIKNSHVKITISVLIINIFWLAPLAFLSVTHIYDGFLLTLLAYFPLVIMSVYFKKIEAKI